VCKCVCVCVCVKCMWVCKCMQVHSWLTCFVIVALLLRKSVAAKLFVLFCVCSVDVMLCCSIGFSYTQLSLCLCLCLCLSVYLRLCISLKPAERAIASQSEVTEVCMTLFRTAGLERYLSALKTSRDLPLVLNQLSLCVCRAEQLTKELMQLQQRGPSLSLVVNVGAVPTNKIPTHVELTVALFARRTADTPSASHRSPLFLLTFRLTGDAYPFAELPFTYVPLSALAPPQSAIQAVVDQHASFLRLTRICDTLSQSFAVVDHL
jgi:hypothetical protein